MTDTAAGKIEALTADQETLLDEFRESARRIGTSTEPADRQRVTIDLVDDMTDGDQVLVARTWRARCCRCGHDTTGLTLAATIAFLDRHPCAQDPRP